MFTNNMLVFIENARLIGIEHGWRSTLNISDITKTIYVNFIGSSSHYYIGSISASFDEINQTETPIHLALKLINDLLYDL